LGDDEVEIPYFEDFSFACGSGSIGEALESETNKLRMSKSILRNLTIDKKNAVATRASGNSMNPTIKDGDTIHIDLGRKTIKDGKIFAICHGDLFYAKRLYNLPLGGVRIVSDNSSEFPEMRITAQEIIDQKFEIVGWIWQISSIESW
jgi:phage repressor protein C with HTH and peptisase S24 domain